ncbi:dTDP-4-dehydrorhamnose 3,5-epimerase [Pseudoduganella violacea]|uniref:dTDP-4-dehydrorhamnose 3,5-epimerase n=1 Tax=Pseudoduganella violacea TaxID=1715466 RepID=A0A7W5B6N9_9BURK|nr:dTDP-4-dehydrorhamnose 3,5-epimerase [Pseudoduganella violacea]MBB3117522.1 dTDP-4-dehydrorhamnose 3,5-epimerase [Pseudoduganella violacea]
MIILPTKLEGCFQIIPNILRDERGHFVKTFHEELFREHGLETVFREEYYSASQRGVLRGLHFQTPPQDHTKLVYCVQGAVLDAAVDLRVGSPTYGQHLTMELSGENGHMLYLAPGVAHGFYTLSAQALMMYKVSTVYAPAHDSGILWNSAGIAWPGDNPVLSQRDQGFAALADFASPFVYRGSAA